MELSPASAPPQLRAASLKHLPAYVRIRDSLLDLIAAGQWKPGDRLPSETELTSRFGVSLGTVRQSIRSLVDEGVLLRRQGAGTFVASTRLLESQVRYYRFAQAPTGPIVDVAIKVLSIRRVATGDWASFLGEDPAGYVLLRRLIRLADLHAIYSESYLPGSRFARVLQVPEARLDGVTLYSFLEGEFGTPTLRNEHFFSVGQFPPPALEALGRRDPVTGCLWEFVAFSYRDAAIEYRRSYLSEMSLRLRLGLTTF
jgi:GntR family transcriptional regulator